MLAIITKMTLTQVSTWFANARRRLKKENKMTWVPKNRTSADSSANANSNTDGKNPDGDNDDDLSSSVKDGSESNLDDTDGDHQIVGCSPPSSMSTDDPTVGGPPKPISYLDSYQPPPVAQHTPFPPPPAAIASTTTSYTTNIYNNDAWGHATGDKPSAASSYFPTDPFSYLKAGNKEDGIPEWTPSNATMSLNGNDAGYFSTGYLPKLSDTTVVKTTMSTYPGQIESEQRSGFDGLGVVGEPGAPTNDYYVPPYHGYHHPPMHHASSSSTYQPLTSHYYGDKATSSVYGSSSMLVDSHPHHHPHNPVDGDSKVPLIRNDFAASGNLYFPPPPHSSYVTDAPQVSSNYYQPTTAQQQQNFTQQVATTSENSSSSATSSSATAALVPDPAPQPPPPTGSLLRVSPSSGQGPASAVSSPPQLFTLQHSSSSTQQSTPQAAATSQIQPHPM